MMNPKVTAGILVVAVFLAGLLSGVLVERAVFAPTPEAQAAAAETSARDGVRSERRHRGRWHGEVSERMARELGLTSEQQARIDEILDEQQRQMRAIMRETRPRTNEVLAETKARVDSVLDPEQRERLKAMHENE
jgi:Spy/CpxP family protein refolding chaperone